MKSHFWNFFVTWYLVMLVAFALYHSQVTKVRISDFKIKKILFQEYQEKHQLPAYLALSKSEFHAGRYAKNRDELLQSGEIRGYALNQVDEIIKIKEKEQFFLSALMWFGLVILFIGFIFWLQLVGFLFLSILNKKNLKKTFLRFSMCSLFIFLAFSASRVMSQQFRENIAAEYDFDEAMQVALKADEYYQATFDHLIRISNSFFKWQMTVDHEIKKTILLEIRNDIQAMTATLQEFKNLKSIFIGFDGEELVIQTEVMGENILNLSLQMEKQLQQAISIQQLEEVLRESLNQYGRFLENLMGRHEVVFSEQAKFLFLPEAIREFDKMNLAKAEQNPQYLYFGYFLYQAMGYLIR
jgi:hypothetical protein